MATSVLFADAKPTNIIHVAAGAAAGGDGSAGHPFSTIQAAVKIATPGTAIYVHEGTYVENVKIPANRSGAESAPIWLVSADGPQAAKIVGASADLPVIQALGVDNYVIKNFAITGGYDGIQFNQSGRDYSNLVNNIVVQGNVISGAAHDGLKVGQANNVFILDNKISDIKAEEGIDLLGVRNAVVARNEISNVGGTTAAIFAKGGSSNITITQNYIHDVKGDGISAGGWSSDASFRPGYLGYEARNVDVTDNKVVNVGKQPISVRGSTDVDIIGNYLQSNTKNAFSVYVTTGNPESSQIRYSSDVLISGNTTVGAKSVTKIDAGNGTDIQATGNGALAWSKDVGPHAVSLWDSSGADPTPPVVVPPVVVTPPVPPVVVTPPVTPPVNSPVTPPVTPPTPTGGWSESHAWTKTISGTGAVDKLVGTSGNDLVDGLSGTDTMSGGAGDDTYVISGYKDVVVETASAGIDTVLLFDNRYQLSENVENLTVKIATGASLFGNGLSNILTGGAGGDILVGAGGSDLLVGGAGVDTFFASGSDGSDTIADFSGQETISLAGDDFASFADLKAALVQSGANTILNFGDGHSLTLTGVTAASLTAENFNFDHLQANVAATGASTNTFGGTSAFDVVIGDVTNDFIDAKGGADLMIGGKGDDTYVVDNVGDRILERSGQGVDQVLVYASEYRMDGQVENATVKTANGATVEGNASANWIVGGAGVDHLSGGGGLDRLTGGAGKDVFVFSHINDGADVVTDFVHGQDKLDLSQLYDDHASGSWSAVKNGSAMDVYFDFSGSHTLIASLSNISSLSASDFII